MRIGKISVHVVSASLLFAALPAFATPRPHRGPTSPNLFNRRTTRASTKVATPRGIASDRATQIQNALIKSGYLSGKPTGTWDAATEAAMQKFQGDNGWQTKLTPDSRAIIKLGLGPSAEASAAPAVQKSEPTTNDSVSTNEKHDDESPNQ